MKQVIEGYGDFSGPELIALTHQPGTPWSKHYKAGERYVVIPNETIQNYFKAKGDANAEPDPI